MRLERGVLQPHGVVVYVMRADPFYDRPGNPYLDGANRPYADNDRVTRAFYLSCREDLRKLKRITTV